MPEARRGAHIPGAVRSLVSRARPRALGAADGVQRDCWSSTCCCASWAATPSRWSRGPPWRSSSRCSRAWSRWRCRGAGCPRGLVCVLPVIDIGVVGLARLDVQVGGAGVLAVIPALWLGARARSARCRGRAGRRALRAHGGAGVPLPRHLDARGSRSLLIPVVAVASALAIAAALEQARLGLGGGPAQAGAAGAALATIEDQRRFSDAILDTVDVGLVLLDADGALPGDEPPPPRRSWPLAFPDGHAGRAGQLGHVYAARRRDAARPARRCRPYRASQGEEFDDQPDLDRPGPAHPPGALGLRAGGARRARAGSPAPRWPTRTSPTSCGRCGSRTSSSPRSPTSCAPR